LKELLSKLNDAQREAVLYCDGPLLILAGAGSGKTRVLTHKVLYLIKEHNIDPLDILAVTFTNKAASEMKERIRALINVPTWDLWVNTFHAACMRILREHYETLGYTKNFVIYDDSDAKRLIKQCLIDCDIDPDQFKPKAVKNAIGRAKNNLISAEKMQSNAMTIFDKSIASVYVLYQKTMQQNDAMDFGDIIFNAVTLLQNHPEILKSYHEKFKYILVDEYQDTNHAQYTLLKLLAKKRKMICVVGDDDQSIYKFRGANIKNILNFEKDYKGVTTIKLEQNYRSTKCILDAAYSVIKHNRTRKDKKLFTENAHGEKIKCHNTRDEIEEARYVLSEIKWMNEGGKHSFKDVAVFFRTNAQCRVFEEEFFKGGIPYITVGGIEFYSRAEIKDMIAYLKIASGSNDIVSIKRSLLRPRRGIGKVTLDKVEKVMVENSTDLFSAIDIICDSSQLGAGAKKKLKEYVTLVETLRDDAKTLSIGNLVTRIYNASGYKEMLEKDTSDENIDRINNVNEFIAGAFQFEENAPDGDVSMYLDFIALVSSADKLDGDDNKVSLITLHKAKGLEYPIVFMTGMEEGIFPHANSMHEKEELEEERRLCYVGITRAKEKLFMTHASSRRQYNMPSFQRPSRFIDDIPDELITGKSKKSVFATASVRQGQRSFTNKDRDKFNKRSFHEDPHGQKFQKKVVNTFFKESPSGSAYKVGKSYLHPVFGKGKVTRVEGSTGNEKLTLFFPKAGEKKIMAKYVQLVPC